MPVVVSGTSTSPGSRARADLAAEVARYVLRPNNPEALSVAADGLNDAIRRLNTTMWEWSWTTQDITSTSPATANTGDYTISGTFLAPRFLELRDGNSVPNGKLDYFAPKTFYEMFAYRTTVGSPDAYTVRNADEDSLLTLNATASSVWTAAYPTMRLYYYQRVGYLTQDSSTLTGPSEVESFLVNHAKGYIAAIYDPSKVAYAEGKAEKFWKDLRSAEIKRQITDWNAGWRP